jgi:hypothetical protein
MVIGSTEPEVNNNCACEGQQQVTRPCSRVEKPMSNSLNKSTITLYLDFKITKTAAVTFCGQLCLHNYWFAFELMDGQPRKFLRQ